MARNFFKNFTENKPVRGLRKKYNVPDVNWLSMNLALWLLVSIAISLIFHVIVLPVLVDKRMTLAVFKKALEPYVGTESQNFKVR